VAETGPDSTTLVDVLTPPGSDNPYPIYDRIRSETPVFWDQHLGQWVLMGYADVVSASRDSRFSAIRVGTDLSWLPEQYRESLAPVFLSLGRQMLFLDPPDHTRIRGLVQKAFTPRVLEEMRGRIEALVDELLDAVARDGEMEVMRDFAMPLPAIVIAELLGVPPEDRAQFQRWSEDFGALISGTRMTGDEAAQHLLGVSELIEYFRDVVEAHRSAPRDDLLQAMIDAEQEGDRLTADELFANAVLLIAAGHLTTAGLISNGLLTLLRHDAARTALAHDPELIKTAVEEVLRFESPIQATERRLKEDVEIGGKQLHAGDFVLLHLGSANRDPEQFEHQNEFDIARRENRHVAFSQGIHFCLGAALARLEGQIAIGTVLRRFPNLRLRDEPPAWEMDLVARGVPWLWVTLG
jgi:cytochrome P450